MSKWYQNRKVNIVPLQEDVRTGDLSDIALQVLASRGYMEPDEAYRMLHGGIADLHHPRLLKDAEVAVSILKEAILKNTKMVVFGDYDTDGVTSVTTMMRLLLRAGASVNYWTNNRFNEGYGINVLGVDHLLQKFPDTELIVTVDNGISAFEGVAYAKSKGIQVVVTDHHDALADIPKADAVVNPKRLDCTYPFKELCGAGVALKVMHLLYEEMGLPLEDVYELLDVVALGTVGDVVKLVDENRIMVRLGIEMMRENKREVFRVLREVTDSTEINAHYTLGFRYSPMINAVGRIDGDPGVAIDMFLTEDVDEMRRIATYLQVINNDRKALTVEQTKLAESIVETQGLDYVNVVCHPDFHEGLIGLIAGRLKEKYNRPFYVLAPNKDFLKGSGRGIDGMDMKKGMDQIANLFIGYGGHAKAAGLSILPKNLDAFKREINRIARETLTEEDFVKVLRAEVVFTPVEMSVPAVESLQALEPFGEGFPKPLFGLSGFQVNKTYFMGSEKQHVKLQANGMDLIMFNHAEEYRAMGEPTQIKAMGFPGINVWQGRTSVQFLVENDSLKPN